MNGKPPDWPPIITGAKRPAWILWRDIAITLAMWGAFLLLVETEFSLIWQRLPALSEVMIEAPDPGLHGIRAELRPSIWFILLLVTVLGVSTIFSRRRRVRALDQPQPSPAADEVLARDLGLDEQELNFARQQKVISLDVGELGQVSVAAIMSS